MDADEMKALYEQLCTYANVDVLPGEMSPRDRFNAIMDFKKTDGIIDCEFGYWADTLKRWHTEGLPADISHHNVDLYFGFDTWKKHVPVGCFLSPEFSEDIIEETERYVIKYDGNRVKCKVFKDGTDTIPHYLDFPIKDRQSYLPFKERLDATLATRTPANLLEIAASVKNRNYVLELFAGSTAGWVRNLMGFEGFATNIYMDPDLIDEMLNDFSAIFEANAKAVTSVLEIDLVFWWEDIAFKNGPIAPPDWFLEKCGPVYKKALDIYKAHGTKFSYVDCDGDNSLLVPTWLNNGVNIIFPLEVNAGVHPQTLREKFPNIRMMGGFDKVVMLQGTDAIRKELLRLKPIVEDGGYIPHVDHRVQPDVSFADYLYYLEAKRDIFGIPNVVNA